MTSKDSTKAFPYLERSERAKVNDNIKALYKNVARGELFSPKTVVILKKYIPTGSTVLDLGSSSGRIFTLFEQIGVTKTHGADIADYLTVARPKESFSTFDFSADRFPYEDDSFDALTSIEVIEHLENPYHFLREAARILKPGGVFILSTPNPDHVFNKISFFIHGTFYRFLDGNDHIMLFAHYLISKGARKYFEILSTQYMFGQFPYRFFNRFSFPENKTFGRTAFYIFRKK